MSSASAGFPVIRRQSGYTRRLCSPYKASKDSASPCWARAIASCSDMPLDQNFPAIVISSLQSVNSDYSSVIVLLAFRGAKSPLRANSRGEAGPAQSRPGSRDEQSLVSCREVPLEESLYLRTVIAERPEQ